MKIIDANNRRAMERVLARDRPTDRAFERRVASIVDRVRDQGDLALSYFAKRFDGVVPPLEVEPDEIRRQAASVPAEIRRAISRTARHVARLSARQIPKPFEVEIVSGVTVAQRVEPLRRVGCYVPGGRFPLPSSLLMTAVPARVAGVREIVAVCPRPEPAIMAAALEAGVTRLFRVGGAHAIAALAYGTDSVPAVDKIVGPGNRYVARAKALVSSDCAIDFYAGPTEIVVVAGSGRADWIAADLVAQAEHDPDARSILITWSRTFATRVAGRVARRVRHCAAAGRSLAEHGVVIVTRTADAAMELANRLAPEHLVVERESLIHGPTAAGAIFVGPFSAQAAGDYATGSNHVLPTSGAARFRGGLSGADFVRVMSVQRLTRQGLARLAPTILALARVEGLHGHAESVRVRLP